MLEKKYHLTAQEMLWDILQLLGQSDLLIKEAREAKVEEYFTPTFRATLRSASRVVVSGEIRTPMTT